MAQKETLLDMLKKINEKTFVWSENCIIKILSKINKKMDLINSEEKSLNHFAFFFRELLKNKKNIQNDFFPFLNSITEKILTEKIITKIHYLILSLLFEFDKKLFLENKKIISNNTFYEENQFFVFSILFYDEDKNSFRNFDSFCQLLYDVRFLIKNQDKIHYQLNFFKLFNKFKTIRNALKTFMIEKQTVLWNDTKFLDVVKEMNMLFVNFQNNDIFFQGQNWKITFGQNLVQFLMLFFLEKALRKKKDFDNKSEEEIFEKEHRNEKNNDFENEITQEPYFDNFLKPQKKSGSFKEETTEKKNFQEEISSYLELKKKEKIVLEQVNEIFIRCNQKDFNYFLLFLDLSKEIEDKELLSYIYKKILKLGIENENFYMIQSYTNLCQILVLNLSENFKSKSYSKNDFAIISLLIKKNNQKVLQIKLKEILEIKLLPYFLEEIIYKKKTSILENISLKDKTKLVLLNLLKKKEKNRKSEFYLNLLKKLSINEDLILKNLNFDHYEQISLNWEILNIKKQIKNQTQLMIHSLDKNEEFILSNWKFKKEELFMLIDLALKKIGLLFIKKTPQEFLVKLDIIYKKIYFYFYQCFKKSEFENMEIYLKKVFREKLNSNSKKKIILKLISQISFLHELKCFYNLQNENNFFLQALFYLTQRNFPYLKSINLLLYLKLMNLEIKKSKLNLLVINKKIINKYFCEKDVKNDLIKLQINVLLLKLKLENFEISEKEFVKEVLKDLKESIFLLKKKLNATTLNYVILICEINQIFLLFTNNQVITLKLVKEIVFILTQLFKCQNEYSIKNENIFYDVNEDLVDNNNIVFKEIYFFLFEKNVSLVKLNFLKSTLYFLKSQTFEKNLFSSYQSLLQNSFYNLAEKTNNFLLFFKTKLNLFLLSDKIELDFYSQFLNISFLEKLIFENKKIKDILQEYNNYLQSLSTPSIFIKYFLKLTFFFIISTLKKQKKNLPLIYSNSFYFKISVSFEIVDNYFKIKFLKNLYEKDYCFLLKELLFSNNIQEKHIFFFNTDYILFVKQFFKEIQTKSKKGVFFALNYIFFKLLNNFMTFFNSTENEDKLENVNFAINLFNFGFIFFAFFCYCFENNFLELSKKYLDSYLSIFTLQKNFLYNRNRIGSLEFHSCEKCKGNKKEVNLDFYIYIGNFINSDYLFKKIYKKFFVLEENAKKIRKTLKRLTLSNSSKTEDIIQNVYLFKKVLSQKNFTLFLERNQYFLNKPEFNFSSNNIAIFSFEWIFNYPLVLPVFYFTFYDQKVFILDTLYNTVYKDLLEMNKEIIQNENHLKNNFENEKDHNKKILFSFLNKNKKNTKDNQNESNNQNHIINLKKKKNSFCKNLEDIMENEYDEEIIYSQKNNNYDTKKWWEERYKRDNNIKNILVEISKKFDYFSFLFTVPIFEQKELFQLFYANFCVNYKLVENNNDQNFLSYSNILFFNTTNLFLIFLYSFCFNIFCSRKNEKIDLVKYIYEKIENFKNKLFFFQPNVLSSKKYIIREVIENVLIFYKRLKNILNGEMLFFVSSKEKLSDR